MDGRPQHGPEVRAEELRHVETYTDRPPSKIGVLLGWHVEEERELVATQIERANDDRLRGKRLGDLPIRLVLRLLFGERAAPHHEKLGTEQSNPLGPVLPRTPRLARHVDVGAEQHLLAVRRHGIQVREQHQLLLPLPCLDVPLPVHVPLPVLRAGDDPTGASVQDQLVSLFHGAREIRESHHRGDLQCAGENGGMGGSGAGVHCQAQYPLWIELNGDAGRQVPPHEDRRLRYTLQDTIRIAQAHEVPHDPGLEVHQVVQPVHDHGVARVTPAGLELQHPQLEGTRRRQVVFADITLHVVHQVGIIEHHELRLEDLRLHRTQPIGGPLLDLRESLPRGHPGVPEPLNLALHLVHRDGVMRDLRALPQHDVRRTDYDPRRRGRAVTDVSLAHAIPPRTGW